MKRSMLAAVFDGKNVEIKSVPVPKLRDIEAPRKFPSPANKTIFLPKEELVLLKVEAASICGTDLHILTGDHSSAPPVILGHEYVGRVVEAGKSVKNIRENEELLMAVDPNIKCGYCRFCGLGMPNHCVNLTTLGIFLDGGFAEYSIVPAKQLYPLPYNMPPERAIFFEPMACVLRAFEKIRPSIGERVLIFGGGPIGCYFTMLCLRSGAERVFVTEPNILRHEIVRSIGGEIIQLTSPNKIIDSIDRLEDRIPNESEIDVVIDACGAPSIVPQAFKYARRGGRVLLFGQQNAEAKTEINPTIINQKELQVFGSYAAVNMLDAITALKDKTMPFGNLITHRVGIEDIPRAFEAMKSGEAMEIVITPKGDKT